MKKISYRFLLDKPTRKQWKRIGVKRRSGIAVPLFSLYSKESVGIGEIPDLLLLIDWCAATNNSVIQLLPLNDAGYEFMPYDSESSFALDPMYLRLTKLVKVDSNKFKKEIMFIKNKFKTGRGRVNYMIKKSKMDLLWKMFKRGSYEKDKSFNKFRGKTKYWLRDYSIYKVIGEKQKTQNWEAWPPKFKDRRIEGIKRFAASNKKRICFYEWLQWQLYEQFRIVSRYAKANKVLLMGDLPFLVSKKSADVWMFRQYFKLDFASGAPPDYFFALGQRWGMPPYDWDKIRENNYDYLAQKLKYSENFYDMYRIDHAIGLFRIWSIPVGEPLQNAGRNGSFDPRDEKYWETHGREILSVMINSTGMLPCAEDLGTVPECSNRVLKSLGIPGMDVQRWMVNPKKEYFFKKPSQYRTNSIAVLSTHDTSAFLGWWKYDFKNPNERGSYVEHIGLLPAIKKHAYIDANVVLRYALETINKARSIFSIQLISDILSIAGYFKNPAESRINIPGTCSNENWSLVMPLSLEEMLCLDINGYLRKTNRDAGRI